MCLTFFVHNENKNGLVYTYLCLVTLYSQNMETIIIYKYIYIYIYINKGKKMFKLIYFLKEYNCRIELLLLRFLLRITSNIVTCIILYYF